MELNKIRIIVNNDGTMNARYSDLTAVINQYATNYVLEVAYLNDIKSARKMKIVFNIKGVSQPSKVLSPTLERIKLEETPERYSYYSHIFKFTQYETQFYQDLLNATLYIYDKDETVISNINLSFVMSKANYNKITPANLENNSSINSVVDAIYNLENSIHDNIYDITESEKVFALKSELPDLSPYYTKTETEDVINENISRVVGGAPEAFDTLKEIYDFILNNREHITDILSALTNKADKSEVYYIDDIDMFLDELRTLINTKQNRLVSRVNIKTINNKDILGEGNLEIKCDLSHLETKADALAKYNNARNYVDTRIADVLNLAPSEFDTLKEIADYILSDKDFAKKVLSDISELRASISNTSSALSEDINDVSDRVTLIENLDIPGTITGINQRLDGLDTSISNKADKSSVYTKDEIDATIGNIDYVLSTIVDGVFEEV